jgi:hypothetical protein
MDWSTGTHDHQPPPRREPPAPTLLETCWSLTAPSGTRVLTCGIYQDTAPGVELRCGFSIDDVLWSERSADVETARAKAIELRGRAAKAYGIA